MFQSATRVSLLILLVSLVGINVFALVYYPDTVFRDVFAVFNTTVVAVTSYFFGKSAGQQEKRADPPPPTPVDKTLDKVENDFTQAGL